MQYTLRLEQENIGISISHTPAIRQKPVRHRNIRSIFLPAVNKEKTYRDSCIEYLNSSHRKIL